MTGKIIDTNVPLTAAGKNSEASIDCQRRCLEVVQSVLEGETSVVIDDRNAVLAKYRQNMHPDPTGSPAEQFLIHVLTNQLSSDCVQRAKLVEGPGGEFVDFPDTDGTWTTDERRCKTFDRDDKKWVALAVRFKKDTGSDAPIVNAADRCWLAFEAHLESAGVKLETLCREERQQNW